MRYAMFVMLLACSDKEEAETGNDEASTEVVEESESTEAEEAGEESDQSDGPRPFTGALQQSTLTSMVPGHRRRSLLSVKNLPDDHRLHVGPLAC